MGARLSGVTRKKAQVRSKRNNPDWKTRVIVYAATVHEIEYEKDGQRRKGIPLVIIAAAYEMQRLWNVCVEAYNRLRLEAKDKPKAERQEIFGRLYNETYPRLAESWLPSTFYKFLWKQFQNAQEAFAKDIRDAPKPHHRMDRIILPHVDAVGGKPVEYLGELNRRKPYYLHPLSTDARGRTLARGFLTINEHRIHFDAVLHRPLPLNAKVKQFALVGKKVNPFGWQWELQIILESPPAELPAADESKWIAIDLGWRVREDGLRVAYWLDYTGAHGEIVLPFKCENYYTKRRSEFVGDGSYNPIIDWRDYASRLARADLYLEETKEHLREEDRSSWSFHAQSYFEKRKYHFYRRPDGAEFRCNAPYAEADFEEEPKRKTFIHLGEREVDGLSMMRGGSLKSLARELDGQAPACLTRWIEDSARDFAQMRAARIRMEAFRENFYRNRCAEWSEKYDCLRNEANLNLKALAEARDQDYPLKLSQKYRQEMASLSKFKLWLEDAFRKRGKIVKNLEAAHTTQTCPECSAKVECGPQLMLTCENGHQWDQDFMSCQNLSHDDWPEVRAKQRVKRAKKAVTK